MDTIYKPEEFNSSEKINVKEYCKKYADLLLRDEPKHHYVDTVFSNLMGMSDKKLNVFHEKCRQATTEYF